MILPLLLLLAQASPEAEIVMDRKRMEASKAAPKPGTDKKAMRAEFKRPAGTQQEFERCMDAALDDPEAGVKHAEAWRLASGGYLARQCLGFAYAQQERWAPALVAFEQAADEADIAGDPASAQLWAQAGNAALAGGNAAKALSLFDAALARGLTDGFEKGEVYLDRARAHVALNQLSEARPDIDKALDQVPKDPLAWLLSATLARRMDNLSLAQAHIAHAVALAKDDAPVALEEGNIAMLSGAEDVARLAWERAVRLGPNSPAGKAAAESLKRLETSAANAKP